MPVEGAAAPAAPNPLANGPASENPAECLLGLDLENGWHVVARREPPIDGGTFSIGYVVKKPNGDQGFLKALNYAWSDDQDDVLKARQYQLTAFNFECDVLDHCKDRKLDRVVHAVERGHVLPPGFPRRDTVYYVIMELADADARSQVDLGKRFDVAARMRTLHQVAVGLDQLHTSRIAHQDHKPSNVLQTPKGAKVSDFGHAARQGIPGPHDKEAVIGDVTYAPPENLYRAAAQSWGARLAGDMFCFGSMIVFMVLGAGMSALLQSRLKDQHRYEEWSGMYAEVLPYLRTAFADVLAELEPAADLEFRAELVAMVRELCELDPLQRGHPRNRTTTPYSLERYISRLNVLAKAAEFRVARPQ